MSNAMLGFLGGILVSFISALLASLIQRHNEMNRRRDQARFDIYMRLMDLNSAYFWIATAELHNEELPRNQKERVFSYAWEIADKLRANDNIECLEETLQILFGSRFPTANERANALSALLDKFSKSANPKYAKIIKTMGEENIRSIASGSQAHKNAPGSYW
jgi:hypothetical protein